MRIVNNACVLENDLAIIRFSKHNSAVEEIYSKEQNISIKGKDSYFFAFLFKDGREEYPDGVELCGDELILKSRFGEIRIEVKSFPRYFTFELKTSLPKDIYFLEIAHLFYEYDSEDELSSGASGLPMTYWSDPKYSPDVSVKETVCKVFPHLRDVGAKYALIISKISSQREILKEVSLNIDRNVGVRSRVGGAFAIDERINYGNYIIQYESSKEILDERIPFYEKLGIDIVDYHHNFDSFRTGDFEFAYYKTAEGFKKNVTDRLEKIGASASLHTYSHYINCLSEGIFSSPRYLKDLIISERYTLKNDIGDDDEYIEAEEDISQMKTDDSFYTQNCPYVIIGDELIQVENTDSGLKIVVRASSGTKKAFHQKGEEIKRPFRLYRCFYPMPGSELFFEIARRTAKAYNDGGFKMIYLDAFDSLHGSAGTVREDAWFHKAAFIVEIIKNCKTDPLIESSASGASIWASGGRRGAWDAPNRAYKSYNKFHTKYNLNLKKTYSTATLGWYNFFPLKAEQPPNYMVKYQHTDDVHCMGSLALMHDFSYVLLGTSPKTLESAGYLRNFMIYKKYDELRKKGYFSKEYRQKLIDGRYEYHLKEKEKGEFVFVEKDFARRKLYDLSLQKKECFFNPFSEQKPFIRFEAMMSSNGDNERLLVEPKDSILEEPLFFDFETPFSIEGTLALNVKITGNGRKGSALAIKMRSPKDRHTMGEYLIDTDFEGEREFILIEHDNGSRPDLPFEKNEHQWKIYGSAFYPESINRIEILPTDEAKGVRISSILASKEEYDILDSPSVKIGDNEVTFDCKLNSGEMIEFDGENAFVYDREGNERAIGYRGSIVSPRGKFDAEIKTKSLKNLTPRAVVTFGFEGAEINP